MQMNVIYLSDASYDPHTHKAGLGIKNLTSDESYSVAVHAACVQEAEEFALLEAINHAIANQYSNCVFVYDNMGIDTKSIGAFYAESFEKIQFLWCKRDYLHEVDRLAAQVRGNKSHHHALTKQILSHAQGISDEELVCALMPLTRGESYGYLCAISATAPMMKPYPSGMKEVNEKVIALLMYAGSKKLRAQLQERFHHRSYKEKVYEELLEQSGFSMEWFDEAAYECQNTLCAA